jgi:MoaA/NifB/PqqE/SkfB family radical SAM enzyme
MNADETLLLSTSTGLICQVQFKTYKAGPVVTGSAPSDVSLERYVELRSNTSLYAPRSLLDTHVVPDANIRELLLAHGISGLTRVSGMRKSFTHAGDLVFSGNLSSPTWMSICVGGRCNSNCSFCYTEWIRDEPDLPSALVRGALQHAAKIPTLHSVVFSGGEPTLRKDLPELINYAHTLKFSAIGLQTNGYRLADACYLRELVTAGLSRVLLSLHGAKRETHDTVAGLKGSFDRALQALALLEQTRISATVNFVMSPSNCSEAPEFTSLVTSASASARIRFSFPIIEGAAFDNITQILLTFPEFVTNCSLAAARNPDARNRIEVANVPPCVSDQLGIEPAYLMSQRHTLIEVSPFYQNNIQRGELLAKLSSCSSCKWDSDCGGVQVPYLTMFADADKHILPQPG